MDAVLHFFFVLEERDYIHVMEAQKNFQVLDEIQTHDLSSSRLNVLTTKVQEALWRAGSKFDYEG